ncbi:trans-1,2-dihydrobenzene-1,2-diol dehydrogenase-like [Choristoneura fumiferana]|uniref:trans-1,2-dihydrobenzene-1,2-diol dehydrogenase-like n=1 Tax=Choristoneura fumiferana TaxID=7141 RepID=UPI003D1597FC
MTVRWGIVSAGKICSDFVNAVNSYPGKGDQVIAAVAARDRSRAEEFAKLHNIATVFDSYQAMADSSGVVDVVYIGALNPDHFALTKLFLKKGKHVLCEKPMCLNLKQTQALVNIARQKKLFLMEAVWSRFAPVYLALEKDIDSGKLGDVKLVEVNFGVPLISVDRLTKKDLGGSALLDIGVYTLQFAQFIFKDEPTKVTAVGTVNEEGVDIIAHIILEYSGGRRAVLNVDATVKLWNKATVTGTKGRATVEDPFHFPEDLTHADGSVENFPLHTSDIPYYFGNSAGLVYESLEVVRCIKEGLLESPRMSLKESLTLAKLKDTIRKQIGVHFDVDDQEFS